MFDSDVFGIANFLDFEKTDEQVSECEPCDIVFADDKFNEYSWG